MSEKAKILIVEDDREWLDIYEMELEDDSYDILTARTVEEASQFVGEETVDVVVTDLRLIGDTHGGMSILDYVKQTRPDIQVIIFTGYGSSQDAQQALRRGALDYLTKPLDYDVARLAIRRAIEARKQYLEGIRKIRERVEGKLVFPDRFLYSSAPMRKVVSEASRQADTANHVMIVGPGGTGKGLLAEAIHLGSERAGFALVNCISLSERTLEHTLFGTEGPDGHWQPGYLQRLAGGTLVLDHVSGLSIRLQELLMQTLLEKRLPSQFGVSAAIDDVRIISTDHEEILEDLEMGLFIPALFKLLAQPLIRVPPLRERRDERHNDVSHLAEYFITKYASGENLPELTDEALAHLKAYPFPQNVRELHLIMRRAVALAGKGPITDAHLPLRVTRFGAATGMGIVPVDSSGDDVLCPHDGFRCDQVAEIRGRFHGQAYIYLRTGSSTASGFAEQVYRVAGQFGLKVQGEATIKEARILPCHFCVPVQSSRYAIIDLTSDDPHLVYELGVLHALGIHTLLLKAVSVPDLPGFEDTLSVEYNTVTEVKDLVQKWIQGFIAV